MSFVIIAGFSSPGCPSLCLILRYACHSFCEPRLRLPAGFCLPWLFTSNSDHFRALSVHAFFSDCDYCNNYQK
jgi:hypothetical protein